MLGFPCGSAGKLSACNMGELGLIPGLGRSPGEGKGSVQFSSVTQSCPTLCDPMTHSTPGLPVHHKLLEFTQIHVHRVSDAIQPSYPLSFPSPPAPNPSQYQSLPTPIFWPGEFHGLYSRWGGKELDTTEQLSTAQHSL